MSDKLKNKNYPKQDYKPLGPEKGQEHVEHSPRRFVQMAVGDTVMTFDRARPKAEMARGAAIYKRRKKKG